MYKHLSRPSDLDHPTGCRFCRRSAKSVPRAMSILCLYIVFMGPCSSQNVQETHFLQQYFGHPALFIHNNCACLFQMCKLVQKKVQNAAIFSEFVAQRNFWKDSQGEQMNLKLRELLTSLMSKFVSSSQF